MKPCKKVAWCESDAVLNYRYVQKLNRAKVTLCPKLTLRAKVSLRAILTLSRVQYRIKV